MKIGFIGAGKVGCTLGRYFVMHGYKVKGYFDIINEAAKYAAKLTDTKEYDSLEGIVSESDIIFITVTDSAIESTWNDVKKLDICNKIICHCSGALSSEVFSGIDQCKAYGYSVHPLFACSSKEESYKDISKAVFTIEGSKEKYSIIYDMVSRLGNKVKSLSTSDKALYHCAAVVVSNQVIGLIKTGVDMLVQCGFDSDEALEALKPLITGNINNIMNQGISNSLTGPVERNDASTIKKHMDCINNRDKIIYSSLTSKLVEIASTKYPDRDYSAINKIIDN